MSLYSAPKYNSGEKGAGGYTSRMVSPSQRLEIKFLSWAEPNNGRMLWQVEVLIDGKNVSDQVFGGWNYINWEIGKLMLEDEHGDFLFIPREGQSVLVRTKDTHLFALPYSSSPSTATFEGNAFKDGYLLQFFSGELLLTYLENLQSWVYKFEVSGYILEARFLNRNEIELDYYMVVDGKRVEEKTIITLKDFKEIKK